ncbi:hypothetical protein [Natronoarchaeum rubrum]|uniref:hypothetical protein n=1 Tax=Natronoarchaeum rubrum TaxID=755311 RepID=UPI00211354E6|nr:hypothetical protein [Natronoarchaeum rubrum]
MPHDNTTNAQSAYDPPAAPLNVYSDLDAEDGASHDLEGETVHVTRHAQERYLQRVEPGEPFPQSRIEREFREAKNVRLPQADLDKPARLHPGSGAVYVYDRDDLAIVTCFIPTSAQLGGDRAGAGEVVT